MQQLTSEGLISLNKSIELLPYKSRQFIEREYLTDAEMLANIGGTLLVDIELYPNYFLCTFKLHNTNKFLSFECGEGKEFNAKFLSWVMWNYRTVGFNSIDYDLLII